MPNPPDQSNGRKVFYNSGLLSRNTRQKENPELPPYSGSVNVRCPHCNTDTEFWLNGEVKEGKYGKFFALRMKPKQAKASPKPPTPRPAKAPEPEAEEDDELSF